MILDVPIILGDVAGHEFHGNQYGKRNAAVYDTAVAWKKIMDMPTTDDSSKAGFVRPDGKYVNMNKGRPGCMNHADLFPRNPGRLQEVIAKGMLRVDADFGIVEVGAKPTPDQRTALRQFVMDTMSGGKTINLDLHNGLGKPWKPNDIDHTEYGRPEGSKIKQFTSHPDDVMSQIDQFYNQPDNAVRYVSPHRNFLSTDIPAWAASLEVPVDVGATTNPMLVPGVPVSYNGLVQHVRDPEVQEHADQIVSGTTNKPFWQKWIENDEDLVSIFGGKIDLTAAQTANKITCDKLGLAPPAVKFMAGSSGMTDDGWPRVGHYEDDVIQLWEDGQTIPVLLHEITHHVLTHQPGGEPHPTHSPDFNVAYRNVANTYLRAIDSPVSLSMGSVQDDLAQAAADTDVNATNDQKQSGNYKKGRVTIAGLGITIENPHMSTRSGIGADGKPWSTVMAGGHYGYVHKIDGDWAPRSEADGDHCDVFVAPGIGNGSETDTAYVIDQTKVGGLGEFDECKIMFGYPDINAAVKAYFDSYSPGWANVADVVQMPLDQLKDWIRSGETSKPAGMMKDGTTIILSRDDEDKDEEDDDEDDDDMIVEPNVLGGHNYRKPDGRTASTRRNVFGGETQVGDGDFETRPGVDGQIHVTGKLKFSLDVPLELGVSFKTFSPTRESCSLDLQSSVAEPVVNFKCPKCGYGDDVPKSQVPATCPKCEADLGGAVSVFRGDAFALSGDVIDAFRKIFNAYLEDKPMTLDIPIELHMATGQRDELIACDLDGTLVKKMEPYNPVAFGDPIPERWDEVRRAIAAGKNVVIFTARVANDPDGAIKEAIEDLCMEELGQVLPVTNIKTPNMVKFVDDRADPVVPDGTDMPSLAASLDVPLELAHDLVLGDVAGHEFHGNQYTVGKAQPTGDTNAKGKPHASHDVLLNGEKVGTVQSHNYTGFKTVNRSQQMTSKVGWKYHHDSTGSEENQLPTKNAAVEKLQAVIDKFQKYGSAPFEAAKLATAAYNTDRAWKRGDATDIQVAEAHEAAASAANAIPEDQWRIFGLSPEFHMARSAEFRARIGNQPTSLSLDLPLVLGDTPGHEFHGNQWTGGGGGAPGAGHNAGDAAMLIRMGQPHPAFANFKQPMRKVLRWCGKEGMNLQQAKAALGRAGLKVPPDPTIRAELPIGARGMTRGGRGAEMPRLTDEQKAILRGRIGATDPGIPAKQAAAAAEFKNNQLVNAGHAAVRAAAQAPAAPPAPAPLKYEDHKDRADRADQAAYNVRDRILAGERGKAVYQDRAAAELVGVKLHGDAAAAARAEGNRAAASMHDSVAQQHAEKAAKYNGKITNDADKVKVDGTQVQRGVKAVDDARKAEQAAANVPAVHASPMNIHPDMIKREGELSSVPATKASPLKEGDHISATIKLTDENGKSCCFKPFKGEHPAHYWGIDEPESTGPCSRREVAAYEVAKAVGMADLVPVTVLRDQPQIKDANGNPQVVYKGREMHGMGSAQDFLSDSTNGSRSANQWDGAKDAERCASLDYILATGDRHGGNWMIDKNGAANGKIHLIDHGYTLPNSPHDIDTRGFFGHARSERTPISPETKASWAGKWPAIKTALQKMNIRDDAIAMCKKRYDTFMAATQYKDLPVSANPR